MVKSNLFSANTEEHFTEEVISFLREQIHLYAGQEILFGGKILSDRVQEDGSNNPNKIGECEILSRGNDEQVSLIHSQLTLYDVIIHNHPSSYLKPSSEDLEIASLYADEIGFMIVDNKVERVNVVIPIPHISQAISLNLKTILASFESEGILSKILPEYEPRPSQKKMAKAVVEAFNQEKILLCEAETGTGKSLSYGLVAGHWTLANKNTGKKKVVISTNTINLQEQLLNKDLPIIRECLRFETGSAPEIVLVKGKNNYLCLRKFEEFKKEFADTFNWNESRNSLHHREEILSWGEETFTGDRNELSFIPDNTLWDQLGCENDTCQRKNCRYENKCFQTRLKKEITKADILVVNHHILCADLAIKKEVGFQNTVLLPPYERLIIDESHHLEDIATIYFGSQSSTFEIKRTLGLIARIDTKKKILKGGLLNRIMKASLPIPNLTKPLKPNPDVNIQSPLKNDENEWQESFYKEINAFIEARIWYEDFSSSGYEKIFSYFEKNIEESFFNHEDRPGQKEYKHRFTLEELQDERWTREYRQPLEQILRHLQGLIDILTHIHSLLTLIHPEDPPPDYLIDLKAYLGRLQNSVSNFQSSMEISKYDEVRWIRVTRNKNQVYFATHISPLEVGHLLREYLFHPLKTVILTSATLTGSGEKPFRHIRERLGIESFGSDLASEICLSNEFDYAQNCRMVVPSDLPPINSREFLSTLCYNLILLLKIFRGRMLWLFTSYSMMHNVYRQILSPAKELGVELWIQGEEPRHEQLRRIKEYRNGVILGVRAFWEGVDIKGDYLSCLVMIKLPFDVPDEPILSARLERMEAIGRNPFMDYSLPQAILRFKQGFGRLIRSAQDRGIFILFDNRVFTKNYGQVFLASLPQGVSPQLRPLEKEWIEKFWKQII